jgi:hypothetical protein
VWPPNGKKTGPGSPRSLARNQSTLEFFTHFPDGLVRYDKHVDHDSGLTVRNGVDSPQRTRQQPHHRRSAALLRQCKRQSDNVV